MGVLIPALRRERWIAHLAFLAYLLLLVTVGLHHEPWFDEAQAWLVARDATPWTIVAHLARYEGTPALWHLLLWAVQRVGLGYGGVWLVSATLAAGGCALILYRSPFPLWLRIGLIFGYFPAYQFAVVARSYALDMLLFPLIATLWAQRTERPVVYALALGLAANTNAYSFLLMLPLGAELAISLRARLIAGEPHAWLAAALYGALAAAVVWQCWPPADLAFKGALGGPVPERAAGLLIQALVDSSDPFAASPSVLARAGGMLISLLIFVDVTLLCFAARRGALLMSGLFVVLAFAALKYSNLWHSGVVYLYLVAMVWICWDARAALTSRLRLSLDGALALLVGFGVCGAAAADARDLVGPSSSSVATARLVQRLRAAQPSLKTAAVGYHAFNVQPFFHANLFVNYDNGAARPAYFQWTRSEAFNPDATSSSLATVATTIRPDVILLSATAPQERPAYRAAARGVGYCDVAEMKGTLIWKASSFGDDDILVLRPCTAARAR